MKNYHIGLIFDCPIHLDESECPFQIFRKEEDIKKRIRMWESTNPIDFSEKLEYHEYCFKKNEP